MKIPLILVLTELMLEWTFMQIGCLGMPIEETGEGVGNPSRFARSVHALHSQLCPEGSSSESCFYSQLSMFMKMQGSLMDPVALRNIGKRNDVNYQYNELDRHKTETSPDFIEIGLTGVPTQDVDTGLNVQQLQRFIYMLNKFKKYFNSKAVNFGENGIRDLESESSLFDATEFGNPMKDAHSRIGMNTPLESIQALNDIMEQGDEDLYDSYTGYEDSQTNSKQDETQSLMNRENIQFPTIRKRQIICQPGVSRLNCYDNALAFYMRLLTSMKAH